MYVIYYKSIFIDGTIYFICDYEIYLYCGHFIYMWDNIIYYNKYVHRFVREAYYINYYMNKT